MFRSKAREGRMVCGDGLRYDGSSQSRKRGIGEGGVKGVAVRRGGRVKVRLVAD